MHNDITIRLMHGSIEYEAVVLETTRVVPWVIDETTSWVVYLEAWSVWLHEVGFTLLPMRSEEARVRVYLQTQTNRMNSVNGRWLDAKQNDNHTIKLINFHFFGQINFLFFLIKLISISDKEESHWLILSPEGDVEIRTDDDPISYIMDSKFCHLGTYDDQK